MEPHHLREQPFEESLRFIAASGQSLSVRQMFMTWMLNTYCVQIQAIRDIEIGTPQRELLLTALQLFGPPQRLHWRNCNDGISKWAWHIHHDQQLQNHLDPMHGWGRSAFWRRYIKHIESIHRHAPGGIAIISLGDIIAVENINKPKQCALFHRHELMPIWRKHRWSGRPFRLPEPIFKLIRSQGWQPKLEQVLESVHNIKGGDWS